jgi:hypothetical protein
MNGKFTKCTLILKEVTTWAILLWYSYGYSLQ